MTRYDPFCTWGDPSTSMSRAVSFWFLAQKSRKGTLQYALHERKPLKKVLKCFPFLFSGRRKHQQFLGFLRGPFFTDASKRSMRSPGHE